MTPIQKQKSSTLKVTMLQMTNAVVHLRRRLSSACSGDKVHFQLVDMAPHSEAARVSPSESVRILYKI